MFARWTSFGIGLWLLLAPLLLGYRSVAPILHDIALGMLACVATLAAREWPLARFTLALPGIWLMIAPRFIAPGDPAASATELAAGAALLVLSLVPNAPARQPAKMPV